MYYKMIMERKVTMKNKEIHITFHNPNTKKETKEMAQTFVSRMAFGFLNELVMKNRKLENTFRNEKLESMESI